MELEPLTALPNGLVQVHLTGFMAVGKTTVGQLLARALTWNFLDLDGLVERLAGEPITAIMEREGEAAFREIERRALIAAANKPRSVVALGGGTLVDPRNWSVIEREATVVWLRCPFEVLQQRLSAEERAQRPLWRNEERARALFDEREQSYASAHHTIDVEGRPSEVAAAVLSTLGIVLPGSLRD